MKRTCLLVLLCFVGITSAEAFQGTTVKLQCNMPRGMDLHATREPSSPVVANVKCGDTLLVIDQRFGSAHLRTEDGKDGYLVEVNMGQYGLQPVSESGAPIAAPTTPQTIPPIRQASREANFPRAEVFGGYSYVNADLGDFLNRQSLNGWAAGVTGNITNWLGLAGQVLGEYGTVSISAFDLNLRPVTAKEDLTVYGGLFGPEFSFRTDSTKLFLRPMAGVVHTKGSNVRAITQGIQINFLEFEESETDFAWSAGGGFDLSLTDHVGLRLFEIDYIGLNSDPVTHHFRAASGVVLTY